MEPTFLLLSLRTKLTNHRVSYIELLFALLIKKKKQGTICLSTPEYSDTSSISPSPSPATILLSKCQAVELYL